MTKVIKLGALSAVACAMLSTTAFAAAGKGAVTENKYTVAKELADISLSTFTIGSKLVNSYIPADIPLANLANPAFTVKPLIGQLAISQAAITAIGTASHTANAGNFTSNNAKLAIVETATGTLAKDDKIIALYTNAASGVLAFAGNGSVQVSNGKKYILAAVDSALNIGDTVDTTADSINAATINDASITLSGVTKGTTSVAYEINLGAADSQVVHDSATATLITTTPAVTSEITALNVLNETIDAIDEGRKAFKAPAKTDAVKVTFTAATIDDAVKWAAADKAVVVLKASKALPTDMAVKVANAASSTAPCTIGSDLTTVTCEEIAVGLVAAGAGDAKDLTITFTPNNAKKEVILDATFKANVAYNFNAATLTDYTTTSLLASDLAAGKWTYNGYNVIVPYVINDANEGMNTFVKLINKNSAEGVVYADIQDDAGNKCQGIELANLGAQKAGIYFAEDIKTAAAATAGATCAAVKYPFSLDMIATVNPDMVETVAVQKLGANGQRVLPVYTNRTTNSGK